MDLQQPARWSSHLDGQQVCFGDRGLPDLERLRSRLRARTPAAVARAQSGPPGHLRRTAPIRRATRRDACRERRALLDALALDATVGRTPRAFSTEEDLATITRNRRLEGVVAKRVDASYQPRRRGGAWLKQSIATARD
jgi:bifunctional non-homologous end joining protein LigD